MNIDPHNPDLTLITPTGGRPEALDLCRRWMNGQDFEGRVQWLVVRDDPPFHDHEHEMGRQLIGRWPKADDPTHTLGLNLLSAIPHVKADKVLIIEDDDAYLPGYVRKMSDLLDRAELVGEAPSVYYHVGVRRYRYMSNRNHASLCQTAMRASVLDTLADCCRQRIKFIDLQLWRQWGGSRKLDTESDRRCVGIKGMPGRPGQGRGWRPTVAFTDDPDLTELRRLIGDAADWYAPRWRQGSP